MTQTELAAVMGTTPSTVTAWETGKSFPHFQVLLKLHDFFEVDLESLVYHDLQKETKGKNKPWAPSAAEAGPQVKLEEFEELKGRVAVLEGRMNKVEGK